MTDRQEEPATEAGPVYDTRALTDDQRSLADDIASAMEYGHEDDCAVWGEDPDGCSCPLLQGVADGLEGANVVEVIQEWGYDPATQRGDRLERQSFRPHPLSEREALPAPLDVERLAQAMKLAGHTWSDNVLQGTARFIAIEYARLSAQPSTEPAPLHFPSCATALDLNDVGEGHQRCQCWCHDSDTDQPSTEPAPSICEDCGHPWANHPRGGMCLGTDGDVECSCIRIPEPSTEPAQGGTE